MQLDSVRELYYNERASQMALSNLVREVQELREPDPILRRIQALKVKIQKQRQEAAAQRPNNGDASDYEDGALGRRTESLTAALGLLEDKLQLMHAANNVPRLDMTRIRADVEREMATKLEVCALLAKVKVGAPLCLARARLLCFFSCLRPCVTVQCWTLVSLWH